MNELCERLITLNFIADKGEIIIKERIKEVDVLRVLAFLSIVFQHVLSKYASTSGITKTTAFGFALLLTLSRFGVPLFIFMTGVVLFYNKDKKINKFAFYKGKFLQIFIPYVLWAVFFYYYNVRKIQYDAITETKVVAAKVLTGSPMYHLWYMVMLFQFYLIYPFIRKLFISLFSKKGIVKHILIVGLFVLFYFILYIFYYTTPQIFVNGGPFWTIFYKYRDRTIVRWFFYFIMGAYAGVNIKDFKNYVLKAFKIIAVLFGGFTIYLSYLSYNSIKEVNKSFAANLNLTSPLIPIMSIYCILGIVFIYRIAVYFAEKEYIYKYSDFIAKYSFGGYLLHPLMVYYVGEYILKVLGNISRGISFIIAFMSCSALTVISAFIISKIPLMNISIKGINKKRVVAR